MSETVQQMIDIDQADGAMRTHSVRRGLFIDQDLLDEAELGREFQVTVSKKKIVISGKSKRQIASEEKERQQALEEFVEFIRNAPEGKLDDASVRHDEYLYGSKP